MTKKAVCLIMLLFCLSGCVNQIRGNSFKVTIVEPEQITVYQIAKHRPISVIGDVMCPSESPDTTLMAFATDGDIVVKDIIYDTEKRFDGRFWRMTQPVWSPSGKKLALKGVKEGETSEKIWLVDAKLGEIESINPCNDTEPSCVLSAPDWLVDDNLIYGVRIDGVQILVNYDMNTNRITEKYPLQSIRLATSSYFGADPSLKDFDLTTSIGAHIAVSPTGTKVAIVAGDIRTNVYILDLQTKELINLTQNSSLNYAFDSPAWSKDDTQLALRKLTLQKYDFWEAVSYEIVHMDLNTKVKNIIYESEYPLVCLDDFMIE